MAWWLRYSRQAVLIAFGLVLLTACGARETPTPSAATPVAQLRLVEQEGQSGDCVHRVVGMGLRPGSEVLLDYARGPMESTRAAADGTVDYDAHSINQYGPSVDLRGIARDGSPVRQVARASCLPSDPGSQTVTGNPAPPAVAVTPSGTGRLQVAVVDTFESACVVRIEGSGLKPGTAITAINTQPGRQDHGTVKQDGTVRDEWEQVPKAGASVTVSAVAADGTTLTTPAYPIICNAQSGPAYYP